MVATRTSNGRFVRAPVEAKPELSTGGSTFAAVVTPAGQAGMAASTLDSAAAQVKHNKHWVYSAVRQVAQSISGADL